MTPADELLSEAEGYCFAKAGEIYAVYLPKGEATNGHLNLPEGNYSVQWFNPREGGNLANGSVNEITGGEQKALGNPPANPDLDWAVLIQAK